MKHLVQGRAHVVPKRFVREFRGSEEARKQDGTQILQQFVHHGPAGKLASSQGLVAVRPEFRAGLTEGFHHRAKACAGSCRINGHDCLLRNIIGSLKLGCRKAPLSLGLFFD